MLTFDKDFVGVNSDVIGDDEFFAYTVNDERQSKTKSVCRRGQRFLDLLPEMIRSDDGAGYKLREKRSVAGKVEE